MEAFLDESGTHKGSPIVTVAGWVGVRWQWKKFLSHWDNKSFHAKDSKSGPLKHGLLEAIQFGELKAVVAWMDPQDYVKKVSPIVKSQLGNAYAICAYACALGICKYCQAHKLGKIAFVIEAGQPNAGWIRHVLERLQARSEFREINPGIASVATANKQDFVQLCTADFLAHSRTSSPQWYGALLKTGQVFQEHITAEKLEKLSEEMFYVWKVRKRGTVKKNANAKREAAQ